MHLGLRLLTVMYTSLHVRKREMIVGSIRYRLDKWKEKHYPFPSFHKNSRTFTFI